MRACCPRMWGVGDAGQVSDGNSSCTGMVGDGLGLLRVDK